MSVIVLLGVSFGIRYAFERVDGEVTGPGGLLHRAIIDDDFSEPGGGWTSADDSSGMAEYAEGAYRLLVEGEGYESARYLEGKSFGAISVEADTWAAGGSGMAGVTCVIQGGQTGYLFLADVATGQFVIGEGTPDSFEILGVGRDLSTPPALRQPPAKNRVGGECISDEVGTVHLAMLVNERAVLTAEDPDGRGTFSGMGVAAYSLGALDARFDNARAERSSTEAIRPPISDGASLQDEAGRPPGKLILRDRFNNDGDWFAKRGADYRLGWLDGAYQILIAPVGDHRYAYRWFDDPYREMMAFGVVTSVATDAPSGGESGLMCIASPEPTDAYVFTVDPDTARYAVLRIQNGGEPQIIASAMSQAILAPPYANAIEARCSDDGGGGARLQMYVNGTLVDEADDPAFASFVGIGLFAENAYGTSDSRFDDLVMTGVRQVKAP